MMADWPSLNDEWIDSTIETQFSDFQAALGAIREIRSRQKISPKEPLEFQVRCSDEVASLLKPMETYFNSMAKASSAGWGENIETPQTNATVRLDNFEIIVDLKDFIDVEAELERNKKQKERLEKQIGGKEKKLQNANFVDRAPADVVERERASLEQLKQELAAVVEALKTLESLS